MITTTESTTIPAGSIARTPRLVAVLSAGAALASLAAPAPPAAADQGLADAGAPSWQQVTSPGPGPFRALAAVSRKVAWVGGDGGELWRTTNGGSTWQDVAPPNSAGQGFRRIIPLGDGRVLLFARGGVDTVGDEPSLAAHIYLSTDNGHSWHTSFVNRDPAAYYGCVDMFADGRHGLALSDPVDGRFRVLATSDGGHSWQVRPSASMPRAIAGEYAFASGTCLQTSGSRKAWFATGFAAARIFHTSDGGRSWTVTRSTLASDPDNAGGVFALAPRGGRHLLAVGGTFADRDLGTDASAYTWNGRTWREGGETGGLRTSVAWVPGLAGTAVSGGFNGTDRTTDGGRTWTTFSALPYEAVDCAPDGTCWGTGEDGTVGRLFLR